MQSTYLSFSQTHRFSALFQDYIENARALRPFYGRRPEPESFGPQMQERNFPAEKRQLLHQALLRQYEQTAHPPISQLNRLLEPSTFTVTTGHQLNIYTGPLYFIYKIITTIRMAQELNLRYPDCHFVPVYWMASEDHDFEEIRSFNLFGRKLSWEFPQAAGAVGKLSPQGAASLAEEFPDIPELFQKAYTESQTLAQATRRIVHELFGQNGLIVIDGDDPALKKQFKQVAHDDLLYHFTQKMVENADAKLKAVGYKPQIYAREINFFYLYQNIRARIEKHQTTFKVLDTGLAFSEAQLLELIENNPERFSPNVVLRPLYQEMILPNLAYVGGPAELAYWMQLKEVFDHYHVPFPILMPRNFAMVVSRSQQKKMDKLGLSAEELFAEETTWKSAYLQKISDKTIDLAPELAALDALFAEITRKAVVVDRSLEGFVAAEHKKIGKMAEAIEKKIRKAEEKNQEVVLGQVSSLREKLFPNGGLQERVENFLNFYINDPYFLARLMQAFHPFELKFQVLTYEE